MKRKQSYERIREGLRRMPRKHRFFAFGIAAMMTIAHFSSLAARFHQDDLPILTVLFVPSLLVVLSILILASSVGLWSRTGMGFVVSTLTLLGVQAAYAIWYWHSRTILAGYASQAFFRDHPEALPQTTCGLIGAERLNILVLGVALALLIWQTKIIVGWLIASPEDQNRPS